MESRGILRTQELSGQALKAATDECSTIDVLAKTIKASTRVNAAKSTIKKNFDSARQHFREKIQPFTQSNVLSNFDGRGDFKAAGKKLEAMNKFVATPFFEFLTAEYSAFDSLKDSTPESTDGAGAAVKKGVQAQPVAADGAAPVAAGNSPKPVSKLAYCKSDELENKWLEANKGGKPADIQTATHDYMDCLIKYATVVEAASFVQMVEALATDSTAINNFVTSFTPGLPIDSVSHTVTFIVTYGGSISPTWTLIQVKGGGSPLAMAQGVRTHQMIISIGPATENQQNIQNGTVTSALTKQ